jgi:NADH:ubiquinone reductase (non-electrogenic)
VKVAKDAITMQNPATGDVAVPYGMAVWSTGIGTRPFVVDFMKQIGQVATNYFVLCVLLSVQLAI